MSASIEALSGQLKALHASVSDLANELRQGIRAVAITRWDKAFVLKGLVREAALPVRQTRIGEHSEIVRTLEALGALRLRQHRGEEARALLERAPRNRRYGLASATSPACSMP